MPERIPGTNIWNLLDGETFETIDGRIIGGPLAGLRVTEYSGTGLLRVQGPNGNYEIVGETIEDFEKVVEKTI